MPIDVIFIYSCVYVHIFSISLRYMYESWLYSTFIMYFTPFTSFKLQGGGTWPGVRARMGGRR